MKFRTLLAIGPIIGAGVMMIASGASAGVIMTETATATGPSGRTVQNRTIYIQGNKQKVEKPGSEAITDLDKGVIYLVDTSRREYVEVPVDKSASEEKTENSGVEAIHLSNTGQTRLIAKQECTEYSGGHGNELERVAVSACVTQNAPWAAEVIAFERKMYSRVHGFTPAQSGKDNNDAAGLMLEKVSVLNFRIPDPAGGKEFRSASLMAQMRVNQIEVKSLPSETFKPPRDFVKVGHRQRGSQTPHPRQAPPDNGLRVRAPMLGVKRTAA